MNAAMVQGAILHALILDEQWRKEGAAKRAGQQPVNQQGLLPDNGAYLGQLGSQSTYDCYSIEYSRVPTDT